MTTTPDPVGERAEPLSGEEAARRYGMPYPGTMPAISPGVACRICHALVHAESSALHIAWHEASESVVGDLYRARNERP